MVVTIDDRRVTAASIPVELESDVRMEPFCFCCQQTTASLSTCSGCKVATYCSKKCQKKDWVRHKQEDECLAVTALRNTLTQIEATIETNRSLIIQELIMKFGDEEDTWLGREEPRLMELMSLLGPTVRGESGSSRGVMDIIAGRFYALQYTTDYMNCMLQLGTLVLRMGHKHDCLAAYEEVLASAVEAKRLTHAVHVDMYDRELPKVLLKLHRDDDAISFIRYWIQWRSRGQGNLRDPLVLRSVKGEWPFPCEPNARLLDIADEIRNCQFEQGDSMSFPAPFCMVALAVKLRYMVVYSHRAERAEAFMETNVRLPGDLKTAVVNFLTGGVEAHILYTEQWTHANRLMDIIEEKYPYILHGYLDPRKLPAPAPGKDGVDDDQAYDARGFICTYAVGRPVQLLLNTLLRRRYDYWGPMYDADD